MASNSKAQYAPPSSQVDLEERLKNDNKSNAVLSTADVYEPKEDDGSGRTFAVKGNETDEYVGTSPEYATYANKTEKPLAGDEDSVEQQVIDSFAEGQAQYYAPKHADSADDAEAEDEDEEEDESQQSGGSDDTSKQTSPTGGTSGSGS